MQIEESLCDETIFVVKNQELKKFTSKINSYDEIRCLMYGYLPIGEPVLEALVFSASTNNLALSVLRCIDVVRFNISSVEVL